MAKTYIDTVKYVVYADVEVNGLVEKPDVVGAIFGQTEGLLGDELDLRELQKNGRIGRIEVELKSRAGRSVGRIILPSSLDMVETSILAAALETVDRVGPCEARITVEKIEDTRNAKRKRVVERAKSLLKSLLTTEIPESKEISELVRQELKTSEISTYGPEKLPSGPRLDSYDSIVIVEGRADVLNLLKNDINNVVAVGGANVPPSLVDLCRKKEATAFLDGDRGGDIILKELLDACEIDYVARAPRGREVEELTRKEIIKCLRSRVPVEQAEAISRIGEEAMRRRRRVERHRKDMDIPLIETVQKKESAPQQVPQELERSLDELENTLRARIYDEDLKLKAELPVRELVKKLVDAEGVYAIVLDGIVTQRLIDLANNKGVKIILGVKMGNIFKKPEGMLISTKAV